MGKSGSLIAGGYRGGYPGTGSRLVSLGLGVSLLSASWRAGGALRRGKLAGGPGHSISSHTDGQGKPSRCDAADVVE